MENFELKINQERALYRELFIKAKDTFNDLLNKMKSDFSCINCQTCCKIRYSTLPPQEIYKLATEDKESISQDYIKLFVPYGENKEFIYNKENNISIYKNNELAKQADPSYVERILARSEEPVYFYYCRHYDNTCKENCSHKNSLCDNFPASITTILPLSCNFIHWQNLAVHKIENEVAPDIALKLHEISEYRNNFECKRTGTCCRLASSEFSYEELIEKANNGDEFARQFTSIFIPHESLEDARKIFPEYVDLMISRLKDDEQLNFFHCKHVQGENICPIYEDRPGICRDFPDNPLSLLPSTCGFCQWKDEVNVAAHTFHAMVQIYGFYLEKIKKSL